MNMIPYVNEPALYPWKPEMTVGLATVVDPKDRDIFFADTTASVIATPGTPVASIFPVKQRGPELFTGQNMLVENGAGGAVFEVDQASRKVTITTAGSNSGYPRINFNIGFVVGKYYEVKGRLLKTGDQVGAGNQVRLNSAGSANNIPVDNVTGVFSGIQVAASNLLNIITNGSITGSITVGELSVKEVIGPFYIQPVVANRSMLARLPASGKRNILTHTENMLNSATWGSNNNATPFEKDGGIVGFVETTATAGHFVTQPHDYPGTRTLRCKVRYLRNGQVRHVRFESRVGAVFSAVFVDLVTGAHSNNMSSAIQTNVTALEDGWFRITITYTGDAPSGGRNFAFFSATVPNGSGVNYTGDGVSGLEFKEIQQEAGTIATPYQKVGPAFDVTEAGVPDVWSLYGEGLTSFISTVDNLTFNASGASFAVAMQSEVKTDGPSGADRVFGCNRDGSSFHNFLLALRPNNASASHSVSWRTAEGLHNASLQTVLNKTKPFAVIGTVSPDGVRAYLDNTLVATSPGAPAGQITSPLTIGSTLQPWNFYGGMFFTRALEAPERSAVNKWLKERLPA